MNLDRVDQTVPAPGPRRFAALLTLALAGAGCRRDAGPTRFVPTPERQAGPAAAADRARPEVRKIEMH